MKNQTNEETLLEIAKEVQRLNKYNIEGLKLTGSLMLYVRGLNKKREATDIDFVSDEIYEDGQGFPIVPEGFELNKQEGGRSSIKCIQFINEDGVKIEFMQSYEHGALVDDILCANVQDMLYAKLKYIQNNTDAKTKHMDDLLYLFSHNELI